MTYILVGLIGLMLGSFTNAFVWRTSKNLLLLNTKKSARFSIIKGRSMCPHCEHTLAARELIPILSWLYLRGKCSYCKKPISLQYPVIELLFMISLLFAYRFWPLYIINERNSILFILFAVILVFVFALSLIDIKHQILPNRFVYPLGFLTTTFIISQAFFSHDFSVILRSVVGSVVLGGAFWLIYQISSGEWIGGGDVRLVFIIGLLLGWQRGVLTIVLASYIASVLVIVLLILRRYTKHMRIPFGPFLLSATYLVFLFGDQFIHTYKMVSGL